MATGVKMYKGSRQVYFHFFLVSAPAATAPDSLVALKAKVTVGTVTTLTMPVADRQIHMQDVFDC